jgi:hypothetical protein
MKNIYLSCTLGVLVGHRRSVDLRPAGCAIIRASRNVNKIAGLLIARQTAAPKPKATTQNTSAK